MMFQTVVLKPDMITILFQYCKVLKISTGAITTFVMLVVSWGCIVILSVISKVADAILRKSFVWHTFDTLPASRGNWLAGRGSWGIGVSAFKGYRAVIW